MTKVRSERQISALSAAVSGRTSPLGDCGNGRHRAHAAAAWDLLASGDGSGAGVASFPEVPAATEGITCNDCGFGERRC
jgi:hypothetical protein